MKILIVGGLGAGKSTLAYELCHKLNLPRLNLDEVARNKADGSWRSEKEYMRILNQFMLKNKKDWVAEGSHAVLIRKINPDFIIYVKVNRLIRLFRFTKRFIIAKRLIGKEIDPDLPVQAYHYRKLSLTKIRDYDVSGMEIINDLKDFFKLTPAPILIYKKKNDLKKILSFIEKKHDRH